MLEPVRYSARIFGPFIYPTELARYPLTLVCV